MDSHPFLKDYRRDGHPELPLASALDFMAWSERLKPPWALGRVEVGRELRVDPAARIRVVREGTRLILREVRPRGRTIDAFFANLVEGIPAPPNLALDPAPLPLELSLEDFYERHAVQGSRLQGIARVLKRTATSLEGLVRTSVLSEWQPFDSRERWHLDPLVVDSAFQLAHFQASQEMECTILPRSMEELVMVLPIAQGYVRVRVEPVGRRQGEVGGNLFLYQGDHLVGWVRGLRAAVVLP